MKKNKIKILIVLLIFTILFSLTYYLFNNINLYLVNKNQKYQTNKVSQTDFPIEEINEQEKKEEINNEIIFNEEKKVILFVLDKKYESKIINGSNLFDFMDNLQKDKINNFSFKYKEYPSLGFFIKEINNIKDGNGKYWIYYVNDKEASVGVSEYKLKAGDIIKWELK